MSAEANLPRLLEQFFTERLMQQRQASAHTIASYRDTFSLLLRFVQERTKKAPSKLSLQDLDAPVIGSFLDHLEQGRGNGARTRNARLAAIHAFFRYAALYEPGVSALIQRVLAIPSKRFERHDIAFLTMRRSRRWWRHRRRRPGSGAGIARCCWSRHKPGCASRS
jgi:integrase/recombinase XerD